MNEDYTTNDLAAEFAWKSDLKFINFCLGNTHEHLALVFGEHYIEVKERMSKYIPQFEIDAIFEYALLEQSLPNKAHKKKINKI